VVSDISGIIGVDLGIQGRAIEVMGGGHMKGSIIKEVFGCRSISIECKSNFY